VGVQLLLLLSGPSFPAVAATALVPTVAAIVAAPSVAPGMVLVVAVAAAANAAGVAAAASTVAPAAAAVVVAAAVAVSAAVAVAGAVAVALAPAGGAHVTSPTGCPVPAFLPCAPSSARRPPPQWPQCRLPGTGLAWLWHCTSPTPPGSNLLPSISS